MKSDQLKRALLVLEDGTVFYGRSTSKECERCAEVVFNTAMTGYQEVCTDPSYANQMIIFTSSHIGNVGVNEQDNESDRVWVEGVIVKEMARYTSNHRAQSTFIDFLEKKDVAWIEGIDTRSLVRHLRDHGSQNACLMVGNPSFSIGLKQARNHPRSEGLSLSLFVIKKQVCDYSSIKPKSMHRIKSLAHSPQPLRKSLEISKKQTVQPSSRAGEKYGLVCVYDFGVKLNIIRTLESHGYQVKIIPGDYPASAILDLKPDYIVLSNGPGDPAACKEMIHNTSLLIASFIPLLGICFGFQLIALAAGARSVKMKFGHRGTNHPVYDLRKNIGYITSQNHGFMIDEDSLPDALIVTHRSLFDQSIQGIAFKDRPVFGVQGHPEASPGPQDICDVFLDFFRDSCKNRFGSEI